MNNGEIYIGKTADLKVRIKEHKTGKVFTTSKYLPVHLVYYEAYLSEEDVSKRERMLKQYGSSWSHLKKRISGSIFIPQERG